MVAVPPREQERLFRAHLSFSPMFLGALRRLGLCSELSFHRKDVESAAPVRGGLWRRVDSAVAGFVHASQCPPSCVLLSEAKPEFRVQSSLGGEPGGAVRVAVTFLKVSCRALHLPGRPLCRDIICLPSAAPLPHPQIRFSNLAGEKLGLREVR